jgi:hypothetical protein
MPIMALYLTLLPGYSLGTSLSVIAFVPVFFSAVLLFSLLFATLQWRRKRTAKWRDWVITFALVACFVGSRYMPQTTYLVQRVAKNILIG